MAEGIKKDVKHSVPAGKCWNRWHSFSALLLAGAVCATVVVSHGWKTTSLVMGGMVVVVVGLMLLRIHLSLRVLSDHSEGLSASAAMAEEHYIDVLLRIARSIEARDKYLIGHSERVGKLSRKAGEYFDLSDHDLRHLEIAGELHDIGMAAVPENIVAGRSKMGLEGFRTVKTHSQIGYDLLLPLQIIPGVLDVVRYHHERMNGTGYPQGLCGEDIPLWARIVAVTDAYDAMTHDRPQRLALSSYAAVQELYRCSPAGYDPDCVDALARSLNFPLLEETMATPQNAVV
ncbi:MAG: HD domain-containing protein [bacterium]|nr:HD domain-containing protein [bacterium]